MASPQLDLLAPFGTKPEDKWFRTAYEWKREDIFKWMEDIAQARGDFDQDTAKTLLAIYGFIISLSLPAGSLYKDLTKQPYSHIARLVNRTWRSGDKTTSKFIVSGWNIASSIYSPAGPLPGPAPGWWCPYDLLGLFLSLLGPAPAAANKNNFFLPLTAVYARWCSRIAGRPNKNWDWKPSIQGEGDLPYVFQCTWQAKVDKSTKQHFAPYFLGASTAGDRFCDKSTGSWRKRVQEARFDMLFSCQKISMVAKNDFKDEKAPNMDKNKARRTMVPFGNCAETYPFAATFLRNKTENESMTGLALKRDFMAEGEYPEYDPYRDSGIWLNSMNPCDNCKYLIGQAGAKESNFGKDQEREKAPIRPPNPPSKAEELLINAF
ncbi:hypothetical protein F4809DRAFT_652013 [Biscogniauxia mediterranea]|nr:hypothetical protein F4809DRAFT_652013 [Biscogniauxia mediterranea]